jgi:hypothetical protein
LKKLEFGPDTIALQQQGDPSRSLFDMLFAAQAAEQVKGTGEAKGTVFEAPGKPTFYGPGRGGIEGKNATKGSVGPNGQVNPNVPGKPSTLWDVANARARGEDTHVTLAAVNGRDSKGNRIGGDFYSQTVGQVLNIPSATFAGPDGKNITLTNVKGIVHDRGGGAKGKDAHFDIALGKNAPDKFLNVARVNGAATDPEVAQVGKMAQQAVQAQAKTAEAAAAPAIRGAASLAYTKAFNEAILSGKSVEESHKEGMAAAQGKTAQTTPSLPPGATQFPGSENFKGNVATKEMQPFQAIVTHVTGKQNIEAQGKFQLSDRDHRGYHFVIDKDGQVHGFGNPDTGRTNHMSGSTGRSDRFDLNNTNTIGIGFIGGTNPNAAQAAAAKGLVEFLQGKYGIGKDQVFGHGELQGKDAERGPGGLYGPKGEGQAMASYLRGGSSATEFSPSNVAAEPPPGTLPSLFGRGPLTPQALPDVTPEVGRPGIPTAPVAPPVSGPLSWTSSPGERGDAPQSVPESSSRGTTNPAEVGPNALTAPVGPLFTPEGHVGVGTPGQTTAAPSALSGPQHNYVGPQGYQAGRSAQEALARGLFGPFYDIMAGLSPNASRGQEPGGIPEGVTRGDIPAEAPAPSAPNMNIDPGGLQDASPFSPGNIAAEPAPTIDLPAITNEETAPVEQDGPYQSPLTSQNEAPGLFNALSGEQGVSDYSEGFVRLLVEGLAMQGVPPDEAMQMVLAAAKRLMDESGLSIEKALQVVAQSMQSQQIAA